MDFKQRQLANKYIDLLLRRKMLISLLFLLSMPLGLATYLFTPKIYQATSLLSYEQQKINPNKMSPDVVSKIRDMVSSLTQIVTSRTNLEKLIVDLNLYPELRKSRPMEDVVDAMRREIKIEPSKQGDIFDGSFRDPEALESTLGIPLLTTVPHIATEAESKRGKWLILFQIVLLLSASIAVVTLFSVVWYRGYIVL